MSASLRILAVSDVSPMRIEGGAERVLWEQASRLVKRGHRVSILSRCPVKGIAETIERRGVRIRHYPVNRRSSLRFLLSSILEARRAFGEAFAEESYDLLQLHQPLSGYGVLRSNRARDLPCLYTFHSPSPLEYVSRVGMTGHHQPGPAGRVVQVMLWGIERACLRRATRIHVLSDFSARLLWKLYGTPSNRIVKIPGGADLKRFQPAPDRRALRKALGLPEDSPVLLTVRNLEARMGLDTLIRAMVILRQQIPDAVLVIGGTGSLQMSLESLTVSLGLQQHVRFLGYVPEADLPRYYQAADVFVLPTRELEGFGLITVESLACGTPVVGTAVGATPEILLPLDPSMILHEATPEAMAEGLARFLIINRSDPAAAEALRQACRRHAELQYDWNRSVADLEETLQGLMAHPGSGRERSGRCPACNGQTVASDLLYRGTTYVRCRRCHTSAAAVLPSTASLRHQYECEYPLRYGHNCIPESRAELFDEVLDRLDFLGRKGRLVDVGCGGGFLLGSARRRDWQAVGLDLSHDACAIARRVGSPAIQAESAALPFRDGLVDAFTLINVLDHTSDPLATLREARRALAPGGLLAIRIPNAGFHRLCIRVLTALGPAVRWYGWDGYPILHLFGFTARGLRSLILRAGFDVIEVRNSSVAAQEFRSPERGFRGAGLYLLHRCFGCVGKCIQFLSRRRWLMGPSIELYARAPSEGGEAKA